MSAASDYAARSKFLRQWALDLDKLAVLQGQLTTTQSELDRTRSENGALRADTEQCKKQMLRQQQTIIAQNWVVKKLEDELDAIKAQFHSQRAVFTEIQQKNDEQNAQMDLIRSIFALAQQKNAKQSQSVGEVNPEPTPAAAGATEEGSQESNARAQASAGTSSATRSETAAPTVASSIPQTSKGPSNSTSSGPNSTANLDSTTQSRSEIIPLLNGLSVSTASGSGTNSGNAIRSRPQAVASSSQPSASTSAAVSRPDMKDEDDDDIDIVDSGSGPPKYLTPLPEGRRKELEAFPEFVTGVDEPAVFTRAFLSATLGGSTQSLIVRIGPQRPLAKDCKIKKFLCPNLSQNPWCPRFPGQHGYMFVGLTDESEAFRESEQLNLFVGVPPQTGKQRTLDVTYLGVYEVFRVQKLTVDEWRTLSPAVQHNYSSTTADREKVTKSEKVKSVVKIQAEYDSGARSVPCVRLRCIDFDETLYAGLQAANSTSNNKRRSDGDSPDPKRTRRETM